MQLDTITKELRTKDFNFEMALHYLKEGKRLERKGWNGKGMFLFVVAGSEFKANREPLLSVLGEGTPVKYNPHIDIMTADGSISGGWKPSNNDLFAEDWCLIK